MHALLEELWNYGRETKRETQDDGILRSAGVPLLKFLKIIWQIYHKKRVRARIENKIREVKNRVAFEKLKNAF